ncbi:PLP-dependent aminotransferase family protein [Pseudomonas kielensis]|uniref:aminotransferase-like domain-containing protein n=1 Tax=Pseudomonas TaxID=286 RepID=UPI00141201A0|nr:MULTISPECIES: PLP-dependent aminotransferase family protein [Pseudomonas]NBB32508.1 aminotransferase class I/II-fold pyridoxal phosphate-dependent enzyme [Pseudomonas sp. BC115LW]WKL54920.1 PLP-dependent aminotransferase family protein [Pseudomonas kielensis]
MELAHKTSRIGQLVEHFSQLIETAQLAQGSRLLSIRLAAKEFDVSTFTVVQAYDRLVALGYVEARKGDGFFVAKTTPSVEQQRSTAPLSDVYWLLDDAFHPDADALQPGSGGLPYSWLDEPGLHLALRALGRSTRLITEYGKSHGNPGLRNWIQRYLSDRGVPAHTDQIVLTNGASQALNLVVRVLLQPGDCVLVDDPGYINLLANLRDYKVKAIGVPWTPQGPDVEKLGALLKEHQPKAFFTNPWLQNPTGASYSPAVAHRVLQLADTHDCWIIEDDVSGQLADINQAPLAAMDNLQRVIHIGSFSKALASSLRVGFITAEPAVAEALLHYKMTTGLYSSQLCEQLTLQMLSDGTHRKRCQKLRDRLLKAQLSARQQLQQLGWQCWAPAAPTPYLWISNGKADFDPVALTRAGLNQNILLSPGCIFRPNLQATPWLRFNVAFGENPAVWTFLAESQK